MIDFKIKLADIPIAVSCFFDSTKDYCSDYFCEDEAQIFVSVSKEMIMEERKKAREVDIAEGREPAVFSDAYLETLTLYRAILEKLLPYHVVLFHSSVLAYEGKAYLFTAPSGTGKTTHSRLWIKNIPGSYILNGDKPLLLFKEEGVYACGVPWQGKEHYGTKGCLPVCGICILERGSVNTIKTVRFEDAFPTLLHQTHRPPLSDGLLETLKLLTQLDKIPLYCLSCNMEDEAALVSFEGMVYGQTSR